MNYQDIVRDFANRTRNNIEVLRVVQKENPTCQIYEVTHLINSMLGLLVFPQQKYVDSIPKTPLEELVRDGWPIPKIVGGYPQVENLNKLIRYLRNAVSHFNIEFKCDTDGNINGLQVWNVNPQNKNITWKAELSLDEIELITSKFIGLLNKHTA